MTSLTEFEGLLFNFAGRQDTRASQSIAFYKDLSVHEENPFESLEEFISMEILDFEAYLEAIELQ